MFSFAASRPRRRISLTPMIDVVFLLLVFFMLAARFGQEQAIPIAPGAGAGRWEGPPRLVDVLPEGQRLNGVPVTPEGLVAGLAPLVTEAGDPVVLRPRDGASLQRLVDVMEVLSAAGYHGLVLAEDR
jgi:biopolymer transport protein ExbD